MNPEIKKIHILCKKISKITDEELRAVEEFADRQSSYIHPLKMSRASNIQRTGSNNHLVIQSLRILRDAINNGKR